MVVKCEAWTITREENRWVLDENATYVSRCIMETETLQRTAKGHMQYSRKMNETDRALSLTSRT